MGVGRRVVRAVEVGVSKGVERNGGGGRPSIMPRPERRMGTRER